jgi:hypothetical protein
MKRLLTIKHWTTYDNFAKHNRRGTKQTLSSLALLFSEPIQSSQGRGIANV